LRELFGISSNVEARRPVAGQVVPTRVEAPPLVPAPLAKKKKWGVKAPRKTGARWALHSTSLRGRGRELRRQWLIGLY
jgi:hypothetical protein